MLVDRIRRHVWVVLEILHVNTTAGHDHEDEVGDLTGIEHIVGVVVVS